MRLIRIWSGCLLALSLVIGAHPFAPPARGLAYTFRLTGSFETRGKMMPGPGMLARGRVVNGVARLDFDSLDNRPIPIGEPGGYMIMGAKSDKLTIVVPSRREYVEIHLTDFAKLTAGAVMAGASGPKLKVSDVKVTSEALGAGRRIAGYATRRYRVTQRYQVTFSAVTESRTRSTHATFDYWVAQGVTGLVNPYMEVERAMTFAAMSALDGGSELMTRTDRARRTLFSGVPLKVASTWTDSDETGAVTNRHTTSELVSITRPRIDSSVMQPPADYLKREFPPK